MPVGTGSEKQVWLLQRDDAGTDIETCTALRPWAAMVPGTQARGNGNAARVSPVLWSWGVADEGVAGAMTEDVTAREGRVFEDVIARDARNECPFRRGPG